MRLIKEFNDSINYLTEDSKDPKNLNNILILIGKARENARRSRVSITLEVWEAINTCWLYLNEELNKKIKKRFKLLITRVMLVQKF